MRGREKFDKIKPFIKVLCRIVSVFPKRLVIKRFYSLRNKKGNLGMLLRYVYIKCISPECGDNVSIHEGVYLLSPENFSCKNNISIHPMSYIDATGGVEIGGDVSIAHGVTIMSTTHNYSDTEINIKDQGITGKKTVIGDNVWIGAKVTVVAGITIESGCVIGANSVVTHDCEKNCVMAGIPAVKLKTRGDTVQ